MQAALITGKELIEFVDFDDPSPEPEQIVVDITLSLIHISEPTRH